MPSQPVVVTNNNNGTATLAFPNQSVTPVAETIPISGLQVASTYSGLDLLILQQGDGVTRSISLDTLGTGFGGVTSVNGVVPGPGGAVTIYASDISIGASFTPSNIAITANNNELVVAQKTQGQINAINGTVATIQTQISTINGQIVTINGQISTINGQIVTINGQITSLQNSVTTINGEIVTINSEIATLQSTSVFTVNSISPVAGNVTIDSTEINYTAPFTNSTVQTISSKLAQTVSVQDFGATGDGITDDTVAFQNAIAYCVTGQIELFVPAGSYVITDTLNIAIGTQIRGETTFQSIRQFSPLPTSSTILFQPTTAKPLFVATGTSYSGFRFYYSIQGLHLKGNSVNSSGNSTFALDLEGVIYSSFQNMGIENFVTPIKCSATINNRFVNIFAQGITQSVIYAGNVETTDVWEQCTFNGADNGITFSGSSISIRFSNCLFETINKYGMDIARECQNILVENCYCENVPFVNTSTNCMFRVGHSGSVLVTQNNLIVIGGMYAGRNAGAVGAFIDADYCSGIIVQGVSVSRFTTGILTSANTLTYAVVVNGTTWLSITTLISDPTKVSGIYGHAVMNAGNGNVQDAVVRNVTALNNGTIGNLLCGTVTPPSTSFAPASDNTYTLGTSGARWSNVYTALVTATSANYTSTVVCQNLTVNNNATVGNLLCGTVTPPSTYFAPSTNGNINLGLSNLRWATVYAVTGTINTSDETSKQQIQPIDDLILEAWGKVNYCKYKYNDAVESKGDSVARWHFGVIAQRVKDAFESVGLDAFSFGVLCYDEWSESHEVLDKDGNILKPYVAAGARYGIRYEEALVLECAYLRSLINKG